MQTRRHFLKTVAAGAAVCAIPAVADLAPPGPTTFALFTKHLIGLDHEKLADTLAAMGITAIEAPIRPGGHVEPERVEEDLPKLVEALKKRGAEIAILASGINKVDSKQHTETVLRTARALGIQRYRMDWYMYDLGKPIWPQLEDVRAKLKGLVALSKQIGILPCYQNHSGGKCIGGPVWDMAMLMRDYQPEEMAWSFDIMHATVDGSTSWPIQVNLVRDHLGVAYFKDFAWEGKSHTTVPLGQGVVSPDYVPMLRKSGYHGPVSLHIEYLAGKVSDKGYLDSAIAATKRDMAVLKSWWA